jgi:hypothetical protein
MTDLLLTLQMTTNRGGRKEKAKGKGPLLKPQVSKAGKKIKRAAERENEP